MAKGIPTKFEALAFVKSGTLPGGTVRAAYANSNVGGSENFVIASSADGVSPFMLSVFSTGGSATSIYLASSAPSTTTATTNAKVGTVAAKAANQYWFGAGWYVVLQAAGLSNINVASYNATITNPQNA